MGFGPVERQLPCKKRITNPTGVRRKKGWDSVPGARRRLRGDISSGRQRMDGLRLFPGESLPAPEPCCRCGASGQHWDRIGEQCYCPDCEEGLVRGEGEPLALRTAKHRCAVCDRPGN